MTDPDAPETVKAVRENRLSELSDEELAERNAQLDKDLAEGGITEG